MRLSKHKRNKKIVLSSKSLLTSLFFGLLFVISIWGGEKLGDFIKNQEKTAPHLPGAKSEEIKEMMATDDIEEQVYWYTRHIEKVGPVQAQEDFQNSGIPYNGQMHLLNHTVGDYIYKKHGPSGITMCRDYFSSSCFHGFIIRGIGNGDLENVDTMMRECKKHGTETFKQCIHGLGHGLLAWVGYTDLIKALDVCDDVKKRVNEFDPTYCHNGVFMENIWGLHDGKPSEHRWVKASDPHFPCNDPRIQVRHLPGCWYNQAIHLNNVYKNDSVKVAGECMKVTDPKGQEMCFDAIFRGLNTTTHDNVALKYKKCEQLPNDWYSKCIETQASASYQQGDNDLPLKICAYGKDSSVKKDCYEKIYGMSKYYENRAGRGEFCMKIPEEYRGNCPI